MKRLIRLFPVIFVCTVLTFTIYAGIIPIIMTACTYGKEIYNGADEGTKMTITGVIPWPDYHLYCYTVHIKHAPYVHDWGEHGKFTFAGSEFDGYIYLNEADFTEPTPPSE